MIDPALLHRYLDGDLPDTERRELEALLEADDALSAEFRALRTFRAAVYDAGRSESIPISKLEELIPSQVPQRKGGIWLFRVAIVAAAIAAGMFINNQDPMRFDITPQVASAKPNSPQHARSWLQKTANLNVPELKFGGKYQVASVSHGGVWGCYRLVIDASGKEVDLYMACDASSLERGQPGPRFGGIQTFVGKGIGWEYGGEAFYLKGADLTTLEPIAETICAELEEIEPKQPAFK